MGVISQFRPRRDGCADATEDLDDDGDGVLDVDDACPISTRITIDHDSDGCMDEYDLDDDNDESLILEINVRTE